MESVGHIIDPFSGLIKNGPESVGHIIDPFSGSIKNGPGCDACVTLDT